jgi:N-acetylglucosaminyl-diphospho-decaprenol L-rhamnosyltransferase
LPVLVTVSIVSHGQAGLVANLLADLARCTNLPLEVVLTLNLEEHLPFSESDHPFPLSVIRNSQPKGFGANHNAAFSHAKGRFFCVLNPDIRLPVDPFPSLTEDLSDGRVGVVAPLVRAPGGGIEDSARAFPTPLAILSKLGGRPQTADYPRTSSPFSPDWVAGMFMLFRSQTFRAIMGFDEKYFLYYEDVDLCARLRRQGLQVLLDPRVECLHEARRASHRNLRYMSWHLRSMLRFFALRALGRR